MPLINPPETAGAPAVSRIEDGVSTALVTVAQFHNQDNQALPVSANGLLGGGVAQLLNQEGNLDRQRETGADNIPPAGVATGTQQLKSPISTTLNGAVAAGANIATLAATKFVNRGANAWIAVGSQLTLEPGTANQEMVYVLTVNYATNAVTIYGTGTGQGFKFAHANAASVAAGAYNEARDATTPDGSSGQGFAAGATYLFNGTLNAGAGGWESERSAAGELDGASGAGTAIAAEYEYNSGGPGGGNYANSFDRARNLQGKGAASGTLSANIAIGVTSIALASAPINLQPGAPLYIFDSVAGNEVVYVANTYTAGANPVPTQTPTQFAHTTVNATLRWDQFAPMGPGLNGFVPSGVGIEEEALYDPVSGLFYLERAATQDGVPGQNVVLENEALLNGAGTLDRGRSVPGATGGAGLGVEAAGLIPTISANQATTPFFNGAITAAQTVKASAGNLYGYAIYNPNVAVAYLQIFSTTTPTLGTTVPILSIPIPASGQVNLAAAIALAFFATAIAIAATTTPGGGTLVTTGLVVNLFYA